MELVKDKTDQEKVQDIQNKIDMRLHEAGKHSYNIEHFQQCITNLNLEVKNLIVDMNKLNDKIKKEKDDQIAKEAPLSIAPEPTTLMPGAE